MQTPLHTGSIVHRPCTRYVLQLMQQPGANTNHLANETSPYLLQHAANPVEWHPWGPAALEKARQENRPILLSIG